VWTRSLQKSCFLETEETLANDDVVEEIDLENLRRPSDAFGDLSIGFRRFCGAGWVVVYEHRSVSRMDNRRPENLTGDRERGIHGSFRNVYLSDAMVLCI
jgi:hypothetical protein